MLAAHFDRQVGASAFSTEAGLLTMPGEQADWIRSIAVDEDRDAFAALFGHFAPRVKRFFMRKRMPDAAAEDLVQEVMLNIWRRAGQYRAESGTVSAWVYGIARNAAVDRLRREARPTLDPDDPALTPSAPPAPEHEAEREGRGEQLRAAIAELPAEQAEVLEHFYFEHRTTAEISDVMGIPVGTVKSRMRLAIERLRSSVSE